MLGYCFYKVLTGYVNIHNSHIRYSTNNNEYKGGKENFHKKSHVSICKSVKFYNVLIMNILQYSKHGYGYTD